jgi:hypothetical protein
LIRQIDHLHAHLLGQGLRELLVGDQPHFFGDLAQQFTGVLLLLLQQHLELLVVDEAQVDENLTDATDCHGILQGEKTVAEEEPRRKHGAMTVRFLPVFHPCSIRGFIYS